MKKYNPAEEEVSAPHPAEALFHLRYDPDRSDRPDRSGILSADDAARAAYGGEYRTKAGLAAALTEEEMMGKPGAELVARLGEHGKTWGRFCMEHPPGEGGFSAAAAPFRIAP